MQRNANIIFPTTNVKTNPGAKEEPILTPPKTSHESVSKFEAVRRDAVS